MYKQKNVKVSLTYFKYKELKGKVGANDLEESILDYGYVNHDDDMVDEI